MIISELRGKSYYIVAICLLLMVSFGCSSDEKNPAGSDDPGPDPQPQLAGYLFEWSRTVSDGWILTGEGSSCDGVSWTGEVHLGGVDGSGAIINSAGTFSFIIPDGSIEGQTTIQTSGTLSDGDDIFNFTDPLPMVFNFSKDAMQAEITIFSNGSGRLDTNSNAGIIVFASVFTTEPSFFVVLTDNPNCK